MIKISVWRRFPQTAHVQSLQAIRSLPSGSPSGSFGKVIGYSVYTGGKGDRALQCQTPTPLLCTAFSYSYKHVHTKDEAQVLNRSLVNQRSMFATARCCAGNDEAEAGSKKPDTAAQAEGACMKLADLFASIPPSDRPSGTGLPLCRTSCL